tara:strand:+ start:129 stop:545 length:417 start_codon:yes stop_codon:yes gene_type:complete
MTLYVTDKMTEFQIMHNPSATFVYFDTEKKDSTARDTLTIKSLPPDRAIMIPYRKNMSSSGAWDKDYFMTKGSLLMSEAFYEIRRKLVENNLVIFPIRLFSFARDTSEQWVSDAMNRGYIEVVNTNPENKNGFEYYAV